MIRTLSDIGRILLAVAAPVAVLFYAWSGWIVWQHAGPILAFETFVIGTGVSILIIGAIATLYDIADHVRVLAQSKIEAPEIRRKSEEELFEARMPGPTTDFESDL